MFTTCQSSEIAMGFSDADQAFRTWSYVELDAIYPWYLIQAGFKFRGARHVKVGMLGCIADLRNFVNKSGQGYWIESVSIITPGYINGTDLWKMENLEQAAVAYDEDSRMFGEIYLASSGLSYSAGLFYGAKRVSISEVVFSASEHLAPANSRSCR
ncbi:MULTISPECIES: hypothetical protein [Pseudomonas]|uniref:hypothetical protein n=1 Tax=Pseudomonas nitroreducens TaxID=46680 RepID=UPI001E469A3A|nr:MULTISPECIES: hypothetical protein [Pseudomonas]MCE4072264.1 hypothetical protein [Pseudomonas nitritireducens]MCE4081870.1 hypothetical protein [Pseudomonas nitroreducens]